MLTICVQYPWSPEEGSRCPRIGVIDTCKLLCDNLEPDSGSL